MPSGEFLRLHAEAPQVLDHRADPVGLLHAKFAGVLHRQALFASRRPAPRAPGISSISAAVMAPSIDAAFELGVLHHDVADQLAVAAFQSRGSGSCAPMPVSKSSSAERVGLRPTPRMVSCDPGTSSAATIKNAAEERSRRHREFAAGQAGPPGEGDLALRRGEVGAEFAQGDLAVVARRHRLRDRGLRPRRTARRRARRSSPARWARAGRSRSGAARPPWISSGGNLSSRAVIRAPISASGRMIRCIGRRDSDSSPKMRVTKGCAARMPQSMRMVEPELPASRSAAGARSPSSPLPLDHAPPCPSTSTSMPSARTQPSVEWQSAPVE